MHHVKHLNMLSPQFLYEFEITIVAVEQYFFSLPKFHPRDWTLISLNLDTSLNALSPSLQSLDMLQQSMLHSIWMLLYQSSPPCS